MGYYGNRDQLDAELIRRHLQAWLDAHGGKNPGNFHSGIFSPIDILATRCGCDRSSIEKFLRGESRWVSFDKADRFLCAIGSPGLWHQDPELAQIYKGVVVGADHLQPLELAA